MRQHQDYYAPSSSQALFSSAQGQYERQWAHTGAQEVLSKHQETLLYLAEDRALAWVAQGGCGISLLGDLQKPPGHGPGQPALGGPA